MSVQSTRGRRVKTAKQNNLLYLYIAVGVVAVIAITGLVVLLTRNNTEVKAPTAPVGRTEEGFYYKGDPNAAVKVIAFEDYQCPGCAYFSRNLAPILERDYINTGRVQFIYHELPLTNIHPNAVAAAEAARCAGDQGKYWEMHDQLFANQSLWAQLSSPLNVFSGYAGRIGIDRAAFDACMQAGTHREAILAAAQEAAALGVQATPSFSVNGQIVDSGRLFTAIDAALRAAGR
ncbi:MAG TPA: disulfide bond formation protein DsbA [Chloroflexus aurantiacus]|jgi:protein-disulfide isomerase|uniref:DSBA oxidoreductase n=1 Tax=Chloroflexus aurantiacus (strain ATCC 29366 / DSM 635 / J-10-fl) TaxID=324602 RepID=A9WGR1_CHLAA|nr:MULTISPECIES: thioredoxin domain-containing protein [Chloroflexus]ABY36227.1 DSBA oxidoreductase [Chloroflexus aurantiacus J-10-fl]RMG45732.1 MAG: DsbA family protein [Chloroflexota bacterium]GIV94884.1 MAG: DSBA oxidoreductase [Chloroflexus sp.]HBW68979.1 disulfide bond formation protein DsbA [Chloroflexus aurantiacus]